VRKRVPHIVGFLLKNIPFPKSLTFRLGFIPVEYRGIRYYCKKRCTVWRSIGTVGQVIKEGLKSRIKK